MLNLNKYEEVTSLNLRLTFKCVIGNSLKRVWRGGAHNDMPTMVKGCSYNGSKILAIKEEITCNTYF